MPRYPQSVLVSCEIPWDEQEHLLEDVLRKEIAMLRAQGFTHLYIFGTAGEGYAVDTARFRQIVSIFHAETNHDQLHPQVGVIGLSTATIVERIGIAYDIGFRCFQISLPSWAALNDTEILTFFEDVCGSFPNAQFLHYNLPRTKRLLGGAEYRRIADRVPNLVATKNTGGGSQRAYDLMTHAPDLMHFFGEDNFLTGCMFGECGLLSSFGPLAPRRAWAYLEAGRTRHAEQLVRLHHDYVRLLYSLFGRLLAMERIDGAYDKLIVRLAGLEEMPLRLLSPYQGFGEADYQECLRIFREQFGDWK